MRRFAGPACIALAVIAMAAAPAGAATIVLLPSPGSMSQPRIFSDGSSDASVYVCRTTSDLRSGRCSLEKRAPPRRQL